MLLIKPKFVFLSALFVSVISMPVHADKSDYIWNIQFEKKLTRAQAGDTKAQYDIGNMYMKGQGTDRSAKEAFKWFQKAAEKGHERAEYKLGYLYYRGDGVKKSPDKAFEWLKSSAEKGYTPAQFYIGKMYASGSGVDRNYETALSWYKKASDQGYFPAKAEVKKLSKLVNQQRQQQAARERQAQQQAAAARTPRKPKPKARPKPQPTVVASVAKPKVVNSSRSSGQRNYTEELITSKWVTGTQQSLFLPSAQTSCKLNSGKLICLSPEVDREAEFGVITYKVETTLNVVNTNGEFTGSYRDNITLVLPNDPDDPDVVIPVNYGWQKPVSLNCRFQNQTVITCRDSNNRRLVFSKS